MNRLLKIAQTTAPGPGVMFREKAYGSHGIQRFLQDVLAVANAPVEGNRYIVTGVGFDKHGERRYVPVDPDDLSGKPPYQALVADFIEPPIQIKYLPVSVKDQCVGVYEIADCQDRPYMMRVDYSEQLRRGDAYLRVNDASIKIGRRILLRMFDERTRCYLPEGAIEVGFPGEIIHKKLYMPTVDMCRLPSVVERTKLGQLVDIRKKTRNSGATTTMARLMHARLFGSDSPYRDRSPTGLIQEIDDVDQKHESDDQLFMFEENAEKLQLVVFNQGDGPVRNATLALQMPAHDALHVATGLPLQQGDDRKASGAAVGIADYPTVSVRGTQIHISSALGEIPAGAPVEAFELPLRICVGSELAGKRLVVRYQLFGSNLRQAVEGRLALSFRAPASALHR